MEEVSIKNSFHLLLEFVFCCCWCCLIFFFASSQILSKIMNLYLADTSVIRTPAKVPWVSKKLQA